MHLSPAITRGANLVAGSHLRRSAPAPRTQASPEAAAEIHAYIGARDLALAEADGTESQPRGYREPAGPELHQFGAFSVPGAVAF
ncbi:hypothetical protein BH20VER1_BH20VER1_28470 [soil metagenome]